MHPALIKAGVIKELEENSAAVKALATGEFYIHEVFDVISEAIELVEVMSPPDISGSDKKAIVRGVFEWMDRKFKVSAEILSVLLGFLPKWLRWMVPGKRIMGELIPLVINLIVGVLNKYVWKKDES